MRWGSNTVSVLRASDGGGESNVAAGANSFVAGYWGNFFFRLDTQGRPRVAFYTQDSNDEAMHYAWSDSTAIAPTGWLSDSLALPPNDDRTVDLALDSQNRPRVAFTSDQEDLDYAECTANCESSNSTWQLQHIETGDELDLNDPIPPGSGCLSSAWMLIGYPSLALDAQASRTFRIMPSTRSIAWAGMVNTTSSTMLRRFALRFPVGQISIKCVCRW